MLKYLYWRYWKYSYLFINPNGTSQFGRICLSSFSGGMIKLGKKIRERIKQLNAKKRDLKKEEDEVLKSTIVENDEFYGLKRRIEIQSLLVIVLIFAEFGLNYFTTFIIFGYDKVGIVWVGIRLAIALSVTVMAIISTERFLEEALPKEKYKSSEPADKTNFLILALWLFCLIAIEAAIYFFGLLRAHDFEGGGVGSEVVVAMIILSMIIPIVAGGVMWDISKYRGSYKTRIKYDKIQKETNKINTLLELLRERENAEFQKEAIDYWNTYNIFKTHKENYNAKHQIDEDIKAHKNYSFLKDFDSFKARGFKDYKHNPEEEDRLSKLSLSDTKIGNKLGQETD